MSFQITIPFTAFQIRDYSGEAFLFSLSDKSVVRVGQSIDSLAQKYAEVIQNELLNKGLLQDLLKEWTDSPQGKQQLSIHFPAAKDGFSFPAFELKFDYFIIPTHTGFRGIVPVLNGVEAFAETEAELVPRLEETIRVTFNRELRLGAVQDIISTIWFDTVQVVQQPITLEVRSPAEVDALEKNNTEKLLPKVAQRLDIPKQVLYGMEAELARLRKALANQFNRSVLLVGSSGVGKSTIVWELARQHQQAGNSKQIWETTASTLVKELTADSGSWQQNMALLCKELTGSDNLLFVRNLKELFSVGQYEGSDVSLADMMRNYINRGEVVMITECTPEELAAIELKSPNFVATFQVIKIQEPTRDMEAIILQKVQDIATHRQVRIHTSAITEVMRLLRRFSPYAGMPGKAIRFLETVILNNPLGQTIDRSVVTRHFCVESGMPIFMVDPNVFMDVPALRRLFHSNVFGQEQAVNLIVDMLPIIKTALNRSGKPISSFLFVGPTGVGKTELAKVIAQFLFGDYRQMVRFDMSEFADPVSVMRLVGTDYTSDGLLTVAVRQNPFCVLLFDEIEKAHASFYDLLLQILDAGRLTDSQGQVVNFCSSIIIMTSNIGANILRHPPISWRSNTLSDNVDQLFVQAVEQYFRPELFNRIEKVVPFAALDSTTIRFIVEREIAQLREREGIKYRRLDLYLEPQVLDFLGKQGYHSQYGARYLQRVIREYLLIPLAKKLNAFDSDDHLQVQISYNPDTSSLHINAQDDPLGLELLLEELDKINQTNHAGMLRREMNSLQENHIFMRMEQELEELEEAKKHPAFWKSPIKSNRYTDLLKMHNGMKSLQQDIEATEISLALSTMHLQSYTPHTYDHLKKLESDCRQYKINLYSIMHPEDNICFMGIYGIPIEYLANVYIAIFQHIGILWTGETVWFREAYYYEAVPANEGVAPQQRMGYIKTPFDSTHQPPISLAPQQPNDKLCGIEFSLTHPGVYPLLKMESGLQRWMLDDEQMHPFWVVVQNRPLETPKHIHRQDFYKNRPTRRIVAPPTLRDSEYVISKDCDRQSAASIIQQILEERFVTYLAEATA